MEKKGNDLLITSKGRQLLELVPSDLKKAGADSQMGEGTAENFGRQAKREDVHERD